jgi:hypothetical protein
VLVDAGNEIKGRSIAVAEPSAGSPEATAPLRVVVTTAGGLFEVESLPPGTYALWVPRRQGRVEDLDERGTPSWTMHPQPVMIHPDQVTDVAVVVASPGGSP